MSKNSRSDDFAGLSAELKALSQQFIALKV